MNMRLAGWMCLMVAVQQTFAVENHGCGCGETVWGWDGVGQCFIPDFERWGWNNQLGVEGGTLELYAGAGQCDIAKGFHVGQAIVTYNAGQVQVTVVPELGFDFTEIHVYVGEVQWAQDEEGKDTVAPGQFPQGTHKGQNGPYTFTVGSTSYYVQVHAVVCCVDFTPAPLTPTPDTAFPTFVDTNFPTTDLNTGFSSAPSKSPWSCPINMSSSPSTYSDECECGQFFCEDPPAPWSTRNYRFCNRCPAYLNGAVHFQCPHCAAGNTELTIECPEEYEACDLFVSVYSNCGAGGTNGGLPYNLISDGWQSGSCGPGFCLSFNDTCQNNQPDNAVEQPDETNIRFRMVWYHKQIGGGEALQLPQLVTEPSMYFTIFVKEGRFCDNSNGGSEEQCTGGTGPGLCQWDGSREEASRCYFDLCPPAPPPPPRAECCDLAPGVEEADCNAGATNITSVCGFKVPESCPEQA
eukprot:Hpha_TRINITY_DN16302_c1_g5::TRINITY_DN16302_c1_g5_i1::g.60420::m.60420